MKTYGTPPPTVPVPSTDGYLSVKELAKYAGLSEKTIRKALVDPVAPLPHYRPNRKILVRRSEFDAWMARWRCRAVDISNDVEEMSRALGV